MNENLWHSSPQRVLDPNRLITFQGCRLVIEQLTSANRTVDELIRMLMDRGFTQRAAEHTIALCNKSGMVSLYFAGKGSVDLYALLTRAGHETLRTYSANKNANIKTGGLR